MLQINMESDFGFNVSRLSRCQYCTATFIRTPEWRIQCTDAFTEFVNLICFLVVCFHLLMWDKFRMLRSEKSQHNNWHATMKKWQNKHTKRMKHEQLPGVLLNIRFLTVVKIHYVCKSGFFFSYTFYLRHTLENGGIAAIAMEISRLLHLAVLVSHRTFFHSVLFLCAKFWIHKQWMFVYEVLRASQKVVVSEYWASKIGSVLASIFRIPFFTFIFI